MCVCVFVWCWWLKLCWGKPFQPCTARLSTLRGVCAAVNKFFHLLLMLTM